MTLRFPEGFRWGVSTASYQIEGAVDEDGRGASIWDTFCRTPGRIENGDTGDAACDHYHRYQEDIALMRAAHMNVYRFSIAWPRILPNGTGAVNEAGLAFYDRLIDALLEAGIEPWPCLYHWDLPQALQDRGGWENRDIASWLSDYAAIVVSRFRDRARHWVILNEPQVVAHRAHAYGMHAPGFRDRRKFFAATHHQNLAQGQTLAALRALDGNLRLGTAFNLSLPVPATQSEADVAATDLYDVMWNRNFLDPLFRGRYPERTASEIAPFLHEGDLALIQQKVDFLGINYYSRSFCAHEPEHPLTVARVSPTSGFPRNAIDWEIFPDGLRQMLCRIRDEYGNPELYITENGYCDSEEPDGSGAINDRDRVGYLDGYLHAAHHAIAEGVNLKGYMAWTLTDNFEWSFGYRPRFGLVHIDFKTQKRTPKASYSWFRDLARTNGLPS